MKQSFLIVGVFLGSFLLHHCSAETTRTLSSLGLTGTFRYTDTENGSTHCRSLTNLTAGIDNISQSYTVTISDSKITINNIIYDNYTGGASGTWCADVNKLYTVSQTFNVVEVGPASTAIAIDNNSTVAKTSTIHNADNYTTHLIKGTVGATIVTCYSEEGNLSLKRGCKVLQDQELCAIGNGGWDNATATTLNGAFGCYISDKTKPTGIFYQDNITKMAGILIDNDTRQVPALGAVKYLTIGFFDNSSSTKHISFREFNGPNIKAGVGTVMDFGLQTHSAFYYTGSTAQDNITSYWGGSDNLSNLLVPVSSL